LLLAPAGTPNVVVDKLNREVKAVIATSEMRDHIVKMGLIPIDTPPPVQLRSFLSSEIQRWRAAVEHAGLAGSVQ
jgi:tripartite-type tricarboxylate transporter receptor subunit TctC